MEGKTRNLAKKITRLLDMFPVVCILGSRQVGKTTLCKQVCPKWSYFDLENPNDYKRIEYDTVLFFAQNSNNIIIDEAQKLPIIFEVLRGVVDSDRAKKGRFIITGSSSPELLKQVTETLAGRIALVELGTFKANEYYEKPLSSFYDLFSSPLSSKLIPLGFPPLLPEQIQLSWVKGGYPEPILDKSIDFYSTWMQNYQNTYVYRDISTFFPKLNKPLFQRFIQMLASLSGTIINKRDLGRALEVDEKTVKLYIDIANGTYIWRNLPSFEKTSVKSIVKMPKGYIRDSGLLHYLLHIATIDQVMSHPIVGYSFESFVIEEILKGLESTMVPGYNAYYFRTKSGAEIDLIIEGNFGILPIEIKYGSSFNKKQILTLEKFVSDNDLPIGILINQGKESYMLTDKVFVVSAGWI